ncbi:hypothetical protein CK220_24450 [Mesorhizobium sp. WSM3860]|nr:hypothetical protein CK220_24450 [Mesorhizobium sp. WSM3860]
MGSSDGQVAKDGFGRRRSNVSLAIAFGRILQESSDYPHSAVLSLHFLPGWHHIWVMDESPPFQ